MHVDRPAVTDGSQRALIAIDSFRREQAGAVRLGRRLKERGFATALCDRRVFERAYRRIAPHVVVLPKLHKIPGWEAIDADATRVFLLSAESFTGSRTGIRAYFNEVASKQLLERLSGIFCWGAVDFDELGRMPMTEQIPRYLTGHPNTDVWYLTPPNRTSADHTRVVGITTSLRSITHHARPVSIVAAIMAMEDNGVSGFFDPPDHSEVWIAYEAAIIRIIHNLATANPAIRFRIRPHPNENPTEYMSLSAAHKNVEVSKVQPFVEWIADVDVVLTAFSTSMLDASVYGRPVFSLSGLIPDYIVSRMPRAITDMSCFSYFPPLDRLDLDGIIGCDFAMPAGVANFLSDVFGFPSRSLPSVNVAEVIVGRSLSHELGPTTRSPILRFSYLDWLASIKMDARQGFKDDPYYKPHRLIRNRKIARAA